MAAKAYFVPNHLWEALSYSTRARRKLPAASAARLTHLYRASLTGAVAQLIFARRLPELLLS